MPRRVLAVAGAVVALHLVLAGRYGFHRDELYFLECARRLAWGYVDQPPFTPAVARLAVALFGESVHGLRLFAALAHGGIVVLCAVTARELGGGRRAALLAALAGAIGSLFLAVGHLFNTTTFDVLAWAALVALVARVLRTGEERLWLAAGAVAGVGLLNKHSVAFLLAGLLAGVVVSRRDLLRSPWLWAGALLALAVWTPNLVWQAQHDWPVVDMSRSLREEGMRDANAVLFLPAQLVFLNPVLAPLWIVGLVWLLRDDAARPFRPVGIAWLVLAVAFVATSGKPYYIAGLYPALLAAGAVHVERRWSERGARRYAAAVVAGGIAFAPTVLPVLPITAVGDGVVAELNPEHRESYGWPELARTVDAVPGAVVFTGNYGEHGAVSRFTDRDVYSGHNNAWWWGPPPDSAAPVVVVGRFRPGFLDAHFAGCRRAATITNPEDVPNDEYGAGVWRCDGPRGGWSARWRALRHYDA